MKLLEKLPFGGGLASGKGSKRAVVSYVFDYAIIIVLLGIFLALDKIEPYHQEFSLKNYTLQYKYAVEERVPNALLVAIAIGAPVVFIVLYTLVVDGIFSHKDETGRKRKYTMSERLWELNCGLLGLALSIGLQYVIVVSLKNAIGKPRPDMIDRCKPRDGSADPLPFGLSNYTICTQEDQAIMRDGFKSFPSGHSSTSFGGLFYLSLYLAAKLHVLDSRGEVWKLFVVLAPSLGAALVAGSRIMDARHHPFDVIVGSLLGILFAWAAYRQYFPPLHDFAAKGRAYPMRTWGTKPLSRRQKDEYAFTYQSPTVSEEDRVGLTTSSSMRPGSSHGHPSGNVFRDEISNTQRHRSYQGRPGGPGAAPAYSADIGEQRFDTPPQQPNVPIGQPPASGPQRRQLRDTEGWEDVSVRDHPSSPDDMGYELQPQYTLSQKPPAEGNYDPYATNVPQDTSYKGATPAGRLPSMRSPEGRRVYPAAPATGAPPMPQNLGSPQGENSHPATR